MNAVRLNSTFITAVCQVNFTMIEVHLMVTQKAGFPSGDLEFEIFSRELDITSGNTHFVNRN